VDPETNKQKLVTVSNNTDVAKMTSDNKMEVIITGRNSDRIYKYVKRGFAITKNVTYEQYVTPKEELRDSYDYSKMLSRFSKYRSNWWILKACAHFKMISKRVRERMYAPGGQGFKRARESFVTITNNSNKLLRKYDQLRPKTRPLPREYLQLQNRIVKYLTEKHVGHVELLERNDIIQNVKVLSDEEKEDMLNRHFRKIVKGMDKIILCHEDGVVNEFDKWWKNDCPWWVWKFRLFFALKSIPSFAFEPKTVEQSQSMYKAIRMLQEEAIKRI
jgi:hypothetical protein